VITHPFEDGNGRIHRYLIHHVLAQRGFSPAGVVFPVSTAILARIDEYRITLEDYSRRLLPVINWQPTADGNVKVLNDTADFYRFFDATPQAEFLFACVRKTVEEDLPHEAEFLQRYDQFCADMEQLVDMPHRTIDLLFHFFIKTPDASPNGRGDRSLHNLPTQKSLLLKQRIRRHFSQDPDLCGLPPNDDAKPRTVQRQINLMGEQESPSSGESGSDRAAFYQLHLRYRAIQPPIAARSWGKPVRLLSNRGRLSSESSHPTLVSCQFLDI
jgi:hypothetical protein